MIDIGCGPGSLTLLLAPLFEEVIGVDPDAGTVADEPSGPEGHRLNDPIRSLITTVTKRPSDLLDVRNLYTYDVLPSAT